MNLEMKNSKNNILKPKARLDNNYFSRMSTKTAC